MRLGRSDRLFLSSTVCATKYRLKCRCYIWASLHSASRAWCRTVGDINSRRLFPKLIMSAMIIKATFSATKKPYFTCIFCGVKIYRSWTLPLSDNIYRSNLIINSAGQWPVTGTNVEAWLWDVTLYSVVTQRLVKAISCTVQCVLCRLSNKHDIR